MRISDWSSDVCSSDLASALNRGRLWPVNTNGVAVAEVVLPQRKERGAPCTGRTQATRDTAMRQNSPAPSGWRGANRHAALRVDSWGSPKCAPRALPGGLPRATKATPLALTGTSQPNRLKGRGRTYETGGYARRRATGTRGPPRDSAT